MLGSMACAFDPEQRPSFEFIVEQLGCTIAKMQAAGGQQGLHAAPPGGKSLLAIKSDLGLMSLLPTSARALWNPAQG